MSGTRTPIVDYKSSGELDRPIVESDDAVAQFVLIVSEVHADKCIRNFAPREINYNFIYNRLMSEDCAGERTTIARIARIPRAERYHGRAISVAPH